MYIHINIYIIMGKSKILDICLKFGKELDKFFYDILKTRGEIRTSWYLKKKAKLSMNDFPKAKSNTFF